MTQSKSKFYWIASVAAVLSMCACYGTIIVISLLSIIGITFPVNETLWAAAIIAFAVIAVGGIGFSMLNHRKPWPLLASMLGVIILIYAMYVDYSRFTEIMGFVLLSLGAFWYWRLRSCLVTKKTTDN